MKKYLILNKKRMPFVIAILVAIPTLFFLVELIVFFTVNDFSVRTKSLPSDIKKVLIIYPHPDDEILTTGGLINKYSQDKEITWVVLSKGERGTPDATVDESLKITRSNEAKEIAKLLNVKHSEHYDFKDNEMSTQKEELQETIAKIIDDRDPDLIITYDLAGLYGHPDHIITSEIVTKIAEERNIKLWYSTNSKRVLDMASLPEHMAKDPQFKEKRVYPTFKIFVGLNGSIAKSRGVSIYESQKQSFTSAYPIKWIPLPVYNLPMVYEYFYEAN